MSDSEDEVEKNVFVELTQDELDRATTEIDSGNENSEAVKTLVEEFDSKGGLHDGVKHDCFPSASTDGRASVEPKVSEKGLLDAIQQDYFPSASIESFELPLSESKRVGSEGKPLVIIDDYIGCSKYFDSGKADVKIFQEFPVLEKMDSGNKEPQKKTSLEEFDSEKSDFSVAGVKIAAGQTPVVIEDNGWKKDHKDESSGVEVRTVGGPDAAIDNAADIHDSAKVSFTEVILIV
ncbi:uncharacterized protein LOC133741766 isoform X2 [Rosa rugosa]|uniref:uncharacterized protein LOC133741766 isoform X2 n=1 Tax=Rosa rugosa TaxID=74645 RepID=UPI002B40A06B|nr:uncharacterized protein LOC133741766 isoform X2 [Rosa rugosa]